MKTANFIGYNFVILCYFKFRYNRLFQEKGIGIGGMPKFEEKKWIFQNFRGRKEKTIYILNVGYTFSSSGKAQ